MASYKMDGSKMNYREEIVKHLGRLEDHLRGIVALRNEYRKQREKVMSFQGILDPEEINRQLQSLLNKHRENLQVARSDFDDLLDKWTVSVKAHFEEPLDLADNALQGALKVIDTVSTSLSFEDVEKLVKLFIGNPAALAVLRSALEGRGITHSIDRYLYDVDLVTVRVLDVSYTSISEQGSLNALASAINQLMAKPEGLQFPKDGNTLIDDAGFDDVIRRAAGLYVVDDI